MDLARILEPFSIHRFVDDYLSKQFLYLPGNQKKFERLLPWEALNDILRHHHLMPPRLKLTKAGKTVAPESYMHQMGSASTRLVSSSLTNALRDGATLIIDGIDQLYEPITQLAQSLEQQLQVRINANMYAAWRLEHGFDVHWDDHDVLVLQVAGRKDWKIFGVTERFPLKHGVDRSNTPPSDPVWVGQLIDGDAIYIPRGWWHVATPCDEPTLHLTIGFRNPTGCDLLRWFIDRLSLVEAVRMDIPLIGDTASRDEYSRSFCQIVSQACVNNVLADFISYRHGSAEPRPAFGLPWSATNSIFPPSGDAGLFVMAPYDFEFCRRVGQNVVDVSFDGSVFTFDLATLPLFECLAGRPKVSLSSFYEEWRNQFPFAQLQEFLSELVKHGIVAIVGDPPLTESSEVFGIAACDDNNGCATKGQAKSGPRMPVNS